MTVPTFDEEMTARVREAGRRVLEARDGVVYAGDRGDPLDLVVQQVLAQVAAESSVIVGEPELTTKEQISERLARGYEAEPEVSAGEWAWEIISDCWDASIQPAVFDWDHDSHWVMDALFERLYPEPGQQNQVLNVPEGWSEPAEPNTVQGVTLGAAVPVRRTGVPPVQFQPPTDDDRMAAAAAFLAEFDAQTFAAEQAAGLAQAAAPVRRVSPPARSRAPRGRVDLSAENFDPDNPFGITEEAVLNQPLKRTPPRKASGHNIDQSRIPPDARWRRDGQGRRVPATQVREES